MRILAIPLIAIGLMFTFIWLGVYSRDNIEYLVSQYLGVQENGTVKIEMWLIEGYVNVYMFIPQCYRGYARIYGSLDGGNVLDMVVEGPYRDTVEAYIPRPGFYILIGSMVRIENCPGPKANGVIGVYQNAQIEERIRTILLASALTPLTLGVITLALSIARTYRRTLEYTQTRTPRETQESR